MPTMSASELSKCVNSVKDLRDRDRAIGIGQKTVPDLATFNMLVILTQALIAVVDQLETLNAELTANRLQNQEPA